MEIGIGFGGYSWAELADTMKILSVRAKGPEAKPVTNCETTIMFSQAGKRIFRGMGCLAVSLMLSCAPGVSLVDIIANNTTSLGGDTPGGRGTIQVSFVNNTPYRAIFTFGVYDPLAPEAFDFQQFTADADPVNRLEGNSSSEITNFFCARAVGIGDTELIDRIRNNETALENAEEVALIEGIAFSDKPLDDPQADAPTVGQAAPVQTLLGADYQCESLLVYTFEVDPNSPNGFRVDLDVVLP